MSARIFLHPRCIPDAPPQAAMLAALQTAGVDINRVCAGPASPKGHRELVLRVSDNPDGSTTYERLSGERFNYAPAPLSPQAA